MVYKYRKDVALRKLLKIKYVVSNTRKKVPDKVKSIERLFSMHF